MPRFYCGKTWLGLTIVSAALGFALHRLESDTTVAVAFITGSLIVSIAAFEFVCGRSRLFLRGLLAILSAGTMGAGGYATMKLESLDPDWQPQMLEGLVDVLAASAMVGGLIVIASLFAWERLIRRYVIVAKSPDGTLTPVASSRFSIADLLGITFFLAIGLALLRYLADGNVNFNELAMLAFVIGLSASWLVATFCAMRIPLEQQVLPRRFLLGIATLSVAAWTAYHVRNEMWRFPFLHLSACLANYVLGRFVIARRYEIRGVHDETTI